MKRSMPHSIPKPGSVREPVPLWLDETSMACFNSRVQEVRIEKRTHWVPVVCAGGLRVGEVFTGDLSLE